MIYFIISSGILYGAYFLLISKPVSDEIRQEKHFKDSKAAADAAIDKALRDDYDYLQNSEN